MKKLLLSVKRPTGAMLPGMTITGVPFLALAIPV